MENQDQWIKLLKSLEFFKSFGDDEYVELLEFCEIKKYDLNDYVVRENEQGDTFYVILKGVVHVILRDALNIKREVGKLSAGDCFGEIAILLDKPRSASVRVGNDAYILKMSSDAIGKLKKDTQIKIYRSFGIMLGKRLIIISGG